MSSTAMMQKFGYARFGVVVLKYFAVFRGPSSDLDDFPQPHFGSSRSVQITSLAHLYDAFGLYCI
jgi:hypothetical protein